MSTAAKLTLYEDATRAWRLIEADALLAARQAAGRLC